MRVTWPTAGSSPEFALRLRAYQQLYWLHVERLRAHRRLYRPHVERLRVHRRLYWLHVESESGSSIDERGVTGGGRCREGR